MGATCAAIGDRFNRLTGVMLLAAVSLPTIAAAQTAPPPPAQTTPSANPSDPVPPPTDTSTQSDTGPGNDIVVTGVRASIQSSNEQKRTQTIISDSLSASDIDGLPATNLGDAIATIPGATTHREKGAASEIAIGGLGPFLSSVNVNGRETTTGNGKRSVNFYLFPSELINQVSIYKTQRADLIEGGTAGTIDSRTARPLDKKGRQIQLSVKGILTGYDHKLDDRAGLGARVTGSYIDQFDLGDAGTLGVLLGVQYQRGNSPEELLGGSSTWVACRGDVAYTATQTCANVTPQNYGATGSGAVPAGTPYYFATNSRNNIQFTTHDRRLAWIGGLQYRSPTGIEANFDVEISDYKFTEDRQIFNLSETTRGIQNPVFGADHILESYSGSSYGEVNPTYRVQDEKYRGGGLNIAIPVTDRFKVAVDGSYSSTRRERMDRVVRLRTNATDIDGVAVPGILTGSNAGRIPYSFQNFNDGTQTIVLNPAFDVNDPDNFSAVPRLRRDDQIRWHKNYATRLDATWETDAGPLQSLKFGGRWSQLTFRSIEQDRKEYNFTGGSTSLPAYNGQPGAYTISTAAIAAANRACREPFPQKDFLSADDDNVISSWASFDARCLFQQFLGTDDPGASTDTRSIANRDIKEITKAAYVMANFASDLGSVPVSGNLGLRYVSTDVTSRGLRGDFTVVNNGDGTIRLQSTGQFTPLVDKFSYDRWLPSLNLSFDVTDKFKVRYAVARSMTKPDPASLANGRTFTFDTTQNFPDVRSALTAISATGNPYTKPLMAWNVDLSLEYYLNRDSYFSLRLFHKNFQGGFVNALVNETYTIGGQTFTVPVTVLQSDDRTNRIDGFELAGSYRASFLPAPFDGLGVRASWARADSNFRQEDLRLGEQVNLTTGQVFARLADPVDIFGLSKDVITVAPYFQYKGLELSPIYKFRSAYYQQFVGDPAQNRVVRDEGTWDLNARYRFNRNFSIEFQATNITDTPRYQDMPVPGSFKEASYYGPTYFFGATWRY